MDRKRREKRDVGRGYSEVGEMAGPLLTRNEGHGNRATVLPSIDVSLKTNEVNRFHAQLNPTSFWLLA